MMTVNIVYFPKHQDLFVHPASQAFEVKVGTLFTNLKV